MRITRAKIYGCPKLFRFCLLCHENSQKHAPVNRASSTHVIDEVYERNCCGIYYVVKKKKKKKDKCASDRSRGLFALSHLWRKLFHSCRPFTLWHVNKYPASPGESVHALSLPLLLFSQIFHSFICDPFSYCCYLFLNSKGKYKVSIIQTCFWVLDFHLGWHVNL